MEKKPVEDIADDTVSKPNAIRVRFFAFVKN